MAFVYMSQRKLSHSNSGQNNDVGPGVYNPILNSSFEKKAKADNYAPFSTTQERSSNLTALQLKQICQTKGMYNQNNPGPGAYNISILDTQLKDKFLISSNQRDIRIIEVPKVQSVFKSKLKRFGSAEKNRTETPGPGRYEIGTTKSLKLKRATTPQPSQNQSNRGLNILNKIMTDQQYMPIPSIPQQNQQFGDYNNKPKINSRSPMEDYLERQKNIGPSTYQQQGEVALTSPKNKAGKLGLWSRSNTKRFKAIIKPGTNEQVGPQEYNPVMDQKPLYKFKQSSNFVSKTDRVPFAQISVKRNTRSTRRINFLDRTIKVNGNADDEVEYMKDATPGPGHYVAEQFTAIKPAVKPEKFQFFGSSSDRFEASKKAIELTMAANKEDSVEASQMNEQMKSKVFHKERLKKIQNTVPFNIGDSRMKSLSQDQELKPGPGQYEILNDLQFQVFRKVVLGYKGNFGSSERRFKPEKMQKQMSPSPVSYDVLSYTAMANKNQNFYKDDVVNLNNKPASFFTSETQRNPFNEHVYASNPGVGKYQINYFDLSKKYQKDFLKFEQIISNKPPFQTSEARFKDENKNASLHKIPEEDEENQYNYIQDHYHNQIYNRIQQSKEKHKREVRSKSPFLSRTTRFQKRGSQGKISPGPADYNADSSSIKDNWHKGTFNMYFANEQKKIELLEKKQHQFPISKYVSQNESQQQDDQMRQRRDQPNQQHKQQHVQQLQNNNIQLPGFVHSSFGT